MTIVLNGVTQTLSGGTLIVYRPNEPQIYTYNSGNYSSRSNDPCEIYWIHFYGNLLPTVFNDLGLNTVQTLNIGVDYEIPKLINSVLGDLILKKFGYEYSCASTLLKLLSLIAYHKNQLQNTLPQQSDTDRFYKVLTIMQNARSDIDLDKYAQICNMSKSRFAHCFKETFGMSPYLYQTKIKIDKAQALLETSTLTIQEISNLLGYDPYYFSRLFKKYTQKSPKRYREEYLLSTPKDEKNVLTYNVVKDDAYLTYDEEDEEDEEDI
jgi:AraC-like DNA-binding protein